MAAGRRSRLEEIQDAQGGVLCHRVRPPCGSQPPAQLALERETLKSPCDATNETSGGLFKSLSCNPHKGEWTRDSGSFSPHSSPSSSGHVNSCVISIPVPPFRGYNRASDGVHQPLWLREKEQPTYEMAHGAWNLGAVRTGLLLLEAVSLTNTLKARTWLFPQVLILSIFIW